MGLPPCPLLPRVAGRMSWKDLESAAAKGEPVHYLTCLAYARQLWDEQGLAARALLAVDRALFCELDSGEPTLREHPLPYAVIGWMVAQDVGGAFFGNPRVHYQHLADRVRGPREHRVRWRSWAAWAIVRVVKPEWPSDPLHEVREPTVSEIREGLAAHGIAGESAVWEHVLSAATEARHNGPRR